MLVMTYGTEDGPLYRYLYMCSCFNAMLFSQQCNIFAGPVTEVKTDIYVTSFGPVSDVEMVSNASQF